VLDLPKEIVWDYPTPPLDAAWRRQRLASFFPHYGRDRRSVAELYANVTDLQVAPEVKSLIALYARAWGIVT
jgi:hypothetical protein